MSNDQKNLYEELIQNMILDGITGMTPELKALVEKAPVEKQRSMILTILEENNVEHRLLCSKIHKTISDSNTTEATHIKSVVQMLREYVKVSATEVKTMGEVMTPIELVEEMLDTLPVDVWSNPNLRWLDPCNGVGTFMSVVVERLMNGLKNFEPDDNKRYKHIIENMIYVCELQAKNMFLFLYAFDPKNEYALNVYNGSFLDEGFDNHMKTLGVEKFDVVVMNPPYQELKPGFKKSQALWDKFVIKVIEKSLVEGGYLVAVHPGGWRNCGGQFLDTQKLILNRQLQVLKIHNYQAGLNVFGAKTDFDFYCLKNTNQSSLLTKIIDIDNKIHRINLKNVQFIPKSNINDVYNLVAKEGEEKVNLLFNSSYHHQRPHMQKEQNEEFKFPCIQNVNVKDAISCLWYSNTNSKGHFNMPKVIFGRKSSGVYIDHSGSYGLAEDCGAILDESRNLDNIKKALQNPRFIKNIMGYREELGDKYNKKIISTFRKDFWVDFLDYDETAVAEEKKKPVKSGKVKVVKKSKKETV